MADIVFNAIKGKPAEKVADSASNLGVLLLKTADSDANLKDLSPLTVAQLLAAVNIEANFTNYARKTGLTGTVTVDNTNDWQTISVPNQTWTSAGGATNNTLAKLVVYYEEAAADSTRIPIVALDFVATTDGTDLIANFNAAGFFKAA